MLLSSLYLGSRANRQNRSHWQPDALSSFGGLKMWFSWECFVTSEYKSVNIFLAASHDMRNAASFHTRGRSIGTARLWKYCEPAALGAAHS